VKLQGGGFSPFYSARSMDGEISEGTDVMVIDPGGGNVVTVESMETIEDDIDRQLAAGREEPQDESAAAAFTEQHADSDETTGDDSATDTADGADGSVDDTERDVEYEQ